MSNDITEAITEQQRYRERKREKCLEKGRNCYGENKERLQNIARGRHKGLSKKEKHKKRGNVRNTRQTITKRT